MIAYNIFITATRLVDGPNQYRGRVEIYNSIYHRVYGYYPIFAQQWGSTCKSYWSTSEATVLCRSLGYHYNEADSQLNLPYGVGARPIWTRYIYCSGNEYYLWECSFRLYYGYYSPRSSCSRDRWVACSGML